ncbi:MAG: amino acid permease [Phycisphaerales bacterium]|nr:amino acid permease [Phycisphaerales bacterium]
MPQPTPNEPAPPALRRDVGVFGATMMGMGSIVGTGVFVSIGIAAGLAGPAVILAIVIAAALAVCNALSSAQLAASYPVSGGTYEYGYRLLIAPAGFTAGWMFLCAKSASAATAALGFAGYLLHGLDASAERWLVPVAAASIAILTIIVLAGVRRANRANIVIVSITLASLTAFVLAGLPTVAQRGSANLTPFFGGAGDSGWDSLRGLLHACALMFVAYTGYGRIATLGEEVRSPRRTIPRAIIMTLILSASLYVAVSVVAVGSLGSAGLSEATQSQAAPLEIAAEHLAWPQVHWIVAIGAMTAMLGVLLNLILGLSRVLLAMGRRRDMPAAVAKISARHSTPFVAVILVGIMIAGLACIGSVKTTWSFSAFTVLIYYAITNLAALRLPAEQRLYPLIFPWGGLVGCVFLAFWVEWQIWVAGLGLIAAGLVWHAVARTLAREPA